jgi:hypothetical protein
MAVAASGYLPTAPTPPEGTRPDNPAGQEGSENLAELRKRAETIWKAGRFKLLILYHWNASAEEWDEIERWE